MKWDSETKIQELQKSPNTKYRMSKVQKDGATYLNMREFYKLDDKWFPAKGGMAVPWLMAIDFVDCLKKIVARESTMSLEELF
jgi:hypothetical protein